MSKSGEINANSLLRAVLCTRCGYSLEGLEPSGRCPECGFGYSPDVLVLFGRGRGLEKTFAAPGVLKMLMYCLLIGAYIAYSQFIPHKYPGHLQWIILLWIFARVIWRRYGQQSEMPAETQIHLSPEGFGLRDGLGDVTIVPWQPKYRVRIRALLWDSYRLQIRVPLMHLISTDPLDFTFHADEPTAIRVAERIEQFRNGAKVERDFGLRRSVQR